MISAASMAALRKGYFSAPLHLQENMASADYIFTTNELARLTADINKVKIVGERYTGRPVSRRDVIDCIQKQVHGSLFLFL